MVPQRVNAYNGQGQASGAGLGTSTVLGVPAQALEANIFDEIEAVVELNDDDTAAAKSVSFQPVTKDTADGSDLTSGEGWTDVGDPIVVPIETTVGGTEAAVNGIASARIHTRQFSGKFAHIEATITHSDAGANTVTVQAVLVGVSQTVDPIVA